MKKAAIDQVFVWILLFVSFVTIFFLILDYYILVKAMDKSDQMAQYGARMKALGKTDEEIVSGLNEIRGGVFNAIDESDLTCTQLGVQEYKIAFNIKVNFPNKFVSDGKSINAIGISFNEMGSFDQECTLTVSKQKEGDSI
jgi:hypothetical protein